MTFTSLDDLVQVLVDGIFEVARDLASVFVLFAFGDSHCCCSCLQRCVEKELVFGWMERSLMKEVEIVGYLSVRRVVNGRWWMELRDERFVDRRSTYQLIRRKE